MTFYRAWDYGKHFEHSVLQFVQVRGHSGASSWGNWRGKGKTWWQDHVWKLGGPEVSGSYPKWESQVEWPCWLPFAHLYQRLWGKLFLHIVLDNGYLKCISFDFRSNLDWLSKKAWGSTFQFIHRTIMRNSSRIPKSSGLKDSWRKMRPTSYPTPSGPLAVSRIQKNLLMWK